MTLRYLPLSNAESVQYYTGHSNERHSSKAVTSALRGLHSVRAQKSHHHPAQTKISCTAEGDVFTSKDDSNNPRAQPTIDTHALQGPELTLSRNLRSFHAGWAATISHCGGGLEASSVVHS